MTKESPLIELNAMFSAPEAQTRSSGAASPPPVTNPFQAPDFGEDDFPFEDAQEPAARLDAARA